MKKGAGYEIIELDGSKLILYVRCRVNDDSSRNFEPVKLDFTDAYVYRDVVKNVDFHNDNAMFYQIRKVLRQQGKVSDQVKNSIIFADFSKTPFVSERERLRCIFEKGIYIKFSGSDEDYTHFITFDKSASMSRGNRISFVSENLKDALDERINLGIDFSSFTVGGSDKIDSASKLSITKYYTYRGLNFTDATRICSEDLVLNEENVIVLDDFNAKLKPIKVITAYEDASVDGMYNTSSKEADDIESNCLDGEGVICPEYAEIISKELGYSESRLSSFQVRMPFTKGMLHKVDFQRFFDEEVIDNSGIVKGNVKITDAFGIERDLSKIKIVLTVSMFKCFKWLKYACENGKLGECSDPMKYYFEKFAEFDHALYVGNTNAMLRHTGRVKFNYQFFNTLKIGSKELNEIIEEYKASIANLEDNYAHRCISERAESVIETFMESGVSETTSRGVSTWIEAAELNPAVLSDKIAKENIRAEKNSMADRIALGRIDIAGEMRFLSGDLMLLLKLITEKSDIDASTKEITLKKIKNSLLFEDRFYMPGYRFRKEDEEKYYGLLRNPHLSRYEQCALRPYVPWSEDKGSKNEKLSLTEKYFGHLSGIVMVSGYGFNAQAVGGADFDGDLVKIVTDRRIVNAILEGCYAEKSRRRSEPYIQIPSGMSGEDIKSDDLKVQPAGMIENTFSNRIGHISNTAVRLGEKEYFGTENDQEYYKDKCAECTIATGLEIDAAKTGKHPAAYIDYIDNFANRKQFSYFIDNKDRIKNNRYGSGLSALKRSPNGNYYIFGTGSYEIRIKKELPETASSNTRLMTRCAEILYDENGKSIFSPKSGRYKRDDVFDFSDCQALTAKEQDVICKVIDAYYSVNSYAVKAGEFDSTLRNSELFGNINVLLRLRYGKMDADFGESGMSVNDVTGAAYIEIKDAIGHNTADVLSKVVSSGWQFTPESKRETKLKELLNVRSLDKNTVALLTDFNCRGYFLLYYIVKDICIQEKLNDDVLEAGNNADETMLNDCTENEFVRELMDIYREEYGKKSAASVIRSALIEKSREILADRLGNHVREDIFDGDVINFTELNDKNRKFFWNVFRFEEIRPYIICTVNPEAQSDEGGNELC